MAETVKDIEVAGKLDEIGQTLKRSFGLQKATLSAVQDQGKPSVREKATKGLDEDVGLAKPKSTGADVGKAKGASDAAKAGSKGFISGFLKYFGLIGLGIFLKDEIGGFIKGAFGSLKDLEAWLRINFDHKTLVAFDDPMFSVFEGMNETEVIDMVTVEATGCEMFAKMAMEYASGLIQKIYGERCWVESVTGREHGANSAICRRKLYVFILF